MYSHVNWQSGCSLIYDEVVASAFMHFTFISQMGSLMDRVASHNGQSHYVNDMESMLQLTNMRSEVMDRTQSVIEGANEYKDNFDK